MRGNTSLVALTAIVLLFIAAFILAVPQLGTEEQRESLGNTNTSITNGTSGTNSTTNETSISANTNGAVNVPEVTGACVTDADCTFAGCSSQVCTTVEKAPTIVSTCEERPEYQCLRHTSCGCISGQCAWAQTPSYVSCLEQASSNR